MDEIYLIVYNLGIIAQRGDFCQTLDGLRLEFSGGLLAIITGDRPIWREGSTFYMVLAGCASAGVNNQKLNNSKPSMFA